MLSVSPSLQIYAYTPPADMRKGFAGMSAIIREEFHSDTTDGSLFLFINRQRDRMKLLHFADGGFWLYYRLLETGTFETLKAAESNSCQLQINAIELSMLLSGVSLAQAGRRRKRYTR